MFEIDLLLVLIPALPLAAALLTAVLGKRILRRHSHLPVVVALALACAASGMLAYQVGVESAAPAAKDSQRAGAEVGFKRVVPLWTWSDVQGAFTQPGPADAASGDARTHDFHIDVALRADPLTAFMLVTVTLVSLLVAVYSIGYMRDDPGYWRFFSYIALFVFSMTMLVSASNFVLLYVFWEAVGLCSYLLIGFWFQKPSAAAAGKKAFLVNRVGDFGFALGLFLIWTTFGTLNYHDTQVIEVNETTAGQGSGTMAHTRVVPAGQAGDAKVVGGQPGVLGQTILKERGYEKLYRGLYGDRWEWAAVAVSLLLLLGACGKSAQFPLHVWLPDAMEGPTPVSALIHAATMVTAGVYMVARCAPLFLVSVHSMEVVATVGGFTALLAALIALTQTDLKRILAYSTISQLGYMFLGLGAASLMGITAGLFHLLTHAFFKALLFLGAGSVMHAMGGVLDVRRFGGLRRLMPVTHWTFLVGCLALAAIFPLAGFWSKDMILAAVAGRSHEAAGGGGLYLVLYAAGMFTALLTALYTFRAYFLTFHGPERIPPEAGHHAHESPGTMTVPLVVLALGALSVGVLFEWTDGFGGFLRQAPSLAYVELAAQAPATAGDAVVKAAADGTAEKSSDLGVSLLSTALALAGVVLAAVLYLGKPNRVQRLTRAMKAVWFYQLSYGKFFFDEIYGLLIVGPLEQLARLCAWGDRRVIDGLVDACGAAPKLVGAMLRPLQNGMLQFYALAMVLGLLVLIGTLLI